MTEQIERIGHMYLLDPQESFVGAVRWARLIFVTSPHLAGFKPTEVRVHPHYNTAYPTGLPEEIDFLPVILDPKVQPGYVYVCCPKETPAQRGK